MSESTSWLLELEIRDGQKDNFDSLMKEMISSTQEEPGALDFEWSVSENKKSCHLFERYADSSAVMNHLATFGQKFADRFFAMLKPVRFTVYGAPGDDVKKALADFHPAYMDSVGGFSR